MREAVVSLPSWEMLNGDGIIEPMALVSPTENSNAFYLLDFQDVSVMRPIREYLNLHT